MATFRNGTRIRIRNANRLAARAGVPGAMLESALGTVIQESREPGGYWVRMDKRLPKDLQGRFPANHPFGRNLLLFESECERWSGDGYAAFHREDFDRAIDEARLAVAHTHLRGGAAPVQAGAAVEDVWWRDATRQLDVVSANGIGEFVYRVGIGSRPISLLVYSSVSRASLWSRAASEDAIRFVYERRVKDEHVHLSASTRVNRSGSAPLDRVVERVVELLDPAVVGPLGRQQWARGPAGTR